MLTAFVAIERRVRSPLVPPRTWKVKTLVSGTGVMLGTTGILVGVIFLTSIFVQTAFGYSALETGLSFLPLALAMTAAAHAASHLTTRASARAIAVAGLGLSVIGALLLSRCRRRHYISDLLPGLLVLGFGVGLVFVSVSVTAMTGIPAQHAGMASGFLMTGHEVGAALGVAVVSAVAATAGSLTSDGRRHRRLRSRAHRGRRARGSRRRGRLRDDAGDAPQGRGRGEHAPLSRSRTSPDTTSGRQARRNHRRETCRPSSSLGPAGHPRQQIPNRATSTRTEWRTWT